MHLQIHSVWYLLLSIIVPTQFFWSYFLCFPCFVRLTTTFPCANFSDLLLFHTWNCPGRQIWFLRKYWQISRRISQYPVSLELGNLQLEHTKFAIFPDRNSFLPFSPFCLFPCGVVQWGASLMNRKNSSHRKHLRRQIESVHRFTLTVNMH